MDDDEIRPLIFDFRVAAAWGYNDMSPRHVVFTKKWQAAMRRDMSKLFGEEVKPNLYNVDRFFWENYFERKSVNGSKSTIIENILGRYCWPDLMPLATRLVLYWAYEGEGIQGTVKNLWGENLNEEQRQHAYLGWYTNNGIPERHINHGAIDDDWLIYHFDTEKIEKQAQIFYSREDFADAVKQSDLEVRSAHVAIRQMLKWFASNEGQEFIQSCERNIRIKYDRDIALRYPEYSKSSPVQQWLSRRP